MQAVADELVFIEQNGKTPVVAIKHAGARVEPNNATVIYIRERSPSPKSHKKISGTLNIANKPGQMNLMSDGRHSIDSYIIPDYKPVGVISNQKTSKKKRNDSYCGLPVNQRTSLDIRQGSQGDFPKCAQDIAYKHDTEYLLKRHSIRSKNTLRKSDLLNRLQISTVVNYCYIPQIEHVFNTCNNNEYCENKNEQNQLW